MSKKVKPSELANKFRVAASTRSGRIHVVSSSTGWVIKKEGAKRAYKVVESKNKALQVAKRIVSNKTIIVHAKDGSIKSRVKGK